MLKTKEKCAITGLPAKYRDPVTGLPYANLEAFKIIREQHTPKEQAAALVSEEVKISGESVKTVATGGYAETTPKSKPSTVVSDSKDAIVDGSVVTAEQLARLGKLETRQGIHTLLYSFLRYRISTSR